EILDIRSPYDWFCEDLNEVTRERAAQACFSTKILLKAWGYLIPANTNRSY
ncbi:2243_t:CDS:1, partial [Entrophospora sp. SA101]